MVSSGLQNFLKNILIFFTFYKYFILWAVIKTGGKRNEKFKKNNIYISYDKKKIQMSNGKIVSAWQLETCFIQSHYTLVERRVVY